MFSNMSATLLVRTRVVHAEDAFADVVLWRVSTSLAGSAHHFKYRLAYVVEGVCVLRFDNEAGKGDHWHSGSRERSYRFTTPEQLLADFGSAITRWNHENRDT